MSERVVDRFEVVEVEHEHGSFGAVASDVLDVAVELCLELAAVQKACEWVVVGHELQPFLKSLAVGDVEELAQQPPGVV